jgi:uncharacterized protein (TIRG00374 family)
MSEQKRENYGQEPPGNYRNRLLASIVAGLGIFIGLSLYSDIRAVTQAFVEFRWGYIPLILALTLLNYFLRFYKWDYYLRNISVRLKVKDSLTIFLSGLTMSVTPAKLGEVFKSYLLKRTNDTEVSRSVPVVFAERITDVLGLLILAAISFSAFQYGKEILVVVLVILLTLIIIIKSRQICSRLIRLTESVPLINKLSDSLRMAYESTHTLFGFKNLIVATVISVISWGFECLAMYFVLDGFGLDSSVLLSTFVFSFSSLVGAVSMIPGGLLVTEGSFAGLLVLSGIAKGIAASATMIIRFCTLWFGVVVGLITLFLIRKKIA